jgi:hypothetical protein
LLDVNNPLQISLDAEDGALSMRMERIGPEACEFASFLADGESRLPEGFRKGKLNRSREYSIFPKHNRLHLTLRPLKGHIQAESKIPLQDGTAVTFERKGESAIISPVDAQLTVLDRKPKLEGQPLVLSSLQGARIETLEPDSESIKVTIDRGKSSRILLGETNEAATPAEYLTSQKPLAAYLSTVALIGSTILTILTRLKLLKSKD